MRRSGYPIIILISFILAAPAWAASAVPGDLNGDKIVSEDEVKAAEKLQSEGKVSTEDLSEIKHIHEQYPRTIIDTKGRNVTIYAPLKRVVCTISHHIETLRSLKVPKDIIVGAPQNIDIYTFFPDYKDLAQVGSFYEPDVEEILKLNPDLVLVHPGTGSGTFGSYLNPLLARMNESGITVACMACSRPEIYPEEIEKLGVLFEREGQARKFIDFYNGVITSVTSKTENMTEDERPLVYSENSPYKASDNDIPPIRMAGGRSFLEGMGDVSEVDREAVVAYRPQIIIRILGDEDYDKRRSNDTAKLEKVRDEILARPELQKTPAVVDRNVYLLASPMWTYMPFSGCRHFIGVAYLAKWFHPDLFKDLDPKAIHQRYLTEFQGLDYDLNKRGVLAYPV